MPSGFSRIQNRGRPVPQFVDSVSSFGSVGAYAISITAIMISLVLITQKSMFDMLRKCEQVDLPFSSKEPGAQTGGSQSPKRRGRGGSAYGGAYSRRRERSLKQEDGNKRSGPRYEEQKADRKQGRRVASFFTAEPPKEEAAQEESIEDPFVPEKAFPIHRGEHLVQDIDEIEALGEETERNQKQRYLRKLRMKKRVKKFNRRAASSRNPRSSKEEIQQGVDAVKSEIAAKEVQEKKEYVFPPVSLLKKGTKSSGDSDAHLRETARKLQETLHNFGVNVTVTNVSCGIQLPDMSCSRSRE